MSITASPDNRREHSKRYAWSGQIGRRCALRLQTIM